MTIQEIELYLKVGCVVIFKHSIYKETITHYDSENVYYTDVRGEKTKESWDSIQEIVSWPKPKMFDKEHSGHYVKFSGLNKVIAECKEDLVNNWFQIQYNPNYSTDIKSTKNFKIIDLKGKVVQPIWYLVSDDHVAEYRPIPPESKPKLLLLKDCPVDSFVKFKKQSHWGSRWYKVTSNSSKEIRLTYNGYEHNPLPDTEVAEVINCMEDIPKHAVVRVKNHINYVPVINLSNYKINDIADILEESVPNNYGDIQPGDLVKHKYINSDKWLVIQSIDSQDRLTFYGIGDRWTKISVTEHLPVRPITQEQFQSIKPGYWVKIAPKEYIESMCGNEGEYKGYKYINHADKKNRFFGNWVKVKYPCNLNKNIEFYDNSHILFCFSLDFIVDISETEPLMYTNARTGAESTFTNCPTYATKEEADTGLAKGSGVAIRLDTVNGHTNPCKEIPLGGYQTVSKISEEQLSIIKSYGTGNMGIKLTGGTITVDESPCFTYDQIKNATKFSKENKELIMLNTVEEIEKMAKPNLEEAAKQIKASRDNDEVAAAKKKLTELLNQESGLKARKKEVDADLAEVQKLIKAFGYPPKE